ncbi:MAG TPA: AMP-binding protein, partial [Pirellulaceae bacterium]|nr:AMP-binding protein [Pirellulaceae bacterium]
MWDQESRTFAELLLRRRETEADAPALWTRSTASTSMASSPPEGIGRWRTWGEVIDDIWRATDALARLGVGAGDRVVQFAENRYEWLVVDQAILALGAIHVPVHSTIGGRQAWQQIDHCGARVALVSDSAQALKLAAHEAERPRFGRSGADDDSHGDFQIVAYGPSETSAASLDSSLSELRIAGRPISIWSELFAAAEVTKGRERAVQFAARGDSATTASILYTSGTMGEPRGAVLTHANLLANVRGIMEAFRERTTELRLCFLPLSHIYARTADLNVWLVSGTQMALATSPETTVEDCQIVRPTFLNGVPYFFGRVAKRLAEAGVAQVPGVLRKTLGGRIELCSCGGAATPESLFDYFHSQGVGLLPGYGLTEASPVVTASTAAVARRGCVGRPLPNVEVRLADDGEILTRGPHVMSGYYRDDAATAAALRDGWLQTGDLGRWEPDGVLRITGRKKELIVTAVGKNVAPSLLESLLTQDPFILQAAVVGEGRNYLGALIVPNRDALLKWATESLASSQASDAANSGDASPASLAWPQLLAHPAVSAEYARRIAQRLADLSPHEQIRRFHLAPRGFTIELDELTPKLSLRRHVIQSHFSTEIAALFDESSASGTATSSSGDSNPKAELTQESAPNFAETTLRMAGKSEEESRRTGHLDRADDQTEKLFQERYQTAQSPLHRAVWDDQIPLELFAPAKASIRGEKENTDNPVASAAIERSLEIVRDAVRNGRLFGDDGKLSDDVVGRLATAGYWGLLVPREHGGAGASFQQFAAMLRRMATWSATAAGWGSVHGCIGAIDPLVTFGTANQQNALLPRLASGETLSAFALTEPWAGSDLTALRTRAERDGDGFRLYGEKLFITNAGPGRVIGLVALLDKQPAVFICELPRVESDEFRFRRYELHALKHSHNCGLVFN